MEFLLTSFKKFARASQAAMILDEMGKLPAHLFALSEMRCSKTLCAETSDARALLCSREVQHSFSKYDGKKEILSANFFLLLQGKTTCDKIGKCDQMRVLTHWLLLAKELTSGS